MRIRIPGSPAGAAVAAIALLAACDGSIVGGGFPYGSYHPATVSYVASRGPIPVRVVGSPNGEAADDVSAAITGRFRLPGSFTPAEFEAVPPGDMPERYHMTFVINPDATPDVRTVCGPDADTILTHASDRDLRILAAWCYADEGLSRVSARSPAMPLGSAGFGHLLDRVSDALFPPYDPDDVDGDKRRRTP